MNDKWAAREERLRRALISTELNAAQRAARAGALEREINFGTERPPNPLREHWAKWLGVYPWQEWGTLTFKEGNFTNEAATRAWAKFAQWLYLPRIGAWFVGHEVGAQGRTHLHCLLGPHHLKRSEVWDWWFKRYGRAEVRGYDPEKGARVYVTKYIAKELAHYDLDLRGFEWHSRLEAKRKELNSSTARGFRRV